ncbi:MAG: barstar family protein [Pseudomonadota bacterium]|jgi:RNAse (barnase) inhibitor barstar
MSRAHYETLLSDVEKTGVYHAPVRGRDELTEAAKSLGYALFPVDLLAVNDKAGLLDAVAAALDFPDWFGHNWDALEDCLMDLSWWPAPGYVVLLENADRLHAAHAAELDTALRIFAAAADSWRREGVPFWTLVDIRADDADWLPELP